MATKTTKTVKATSNVSINTPVKTKTTEEIKAFIYKKGYELTNPEMVEKLGVSTMTFAGILAGMKRKGEMPNQFLKTDREKFEKKTK
jgi:hypothetical protein